MGIVLTQRVFSIARHKVKIAFLVEFIPSRTNTGAPTLITLQFPEKFQCAVDQRCGIKTVARFRDSNRTKEQSRTDFHYLNIHCTLCFVTCILIPAERAMVVELRFRIVVFVLNQQMQKDFLRMIERNFIRRLTTLKTKWKNKIDAPD